MLPLAAAALASFVAGFIAAIAGGGELVSVPALFGIFPRAPAAELFGTNKVAMGSGTLQAAGSYARRVSLPWPTLLPDMAAAVICAALGATAMTLVANDYLRRLLPLLLGTVLAQTLLQPDLGTIHAPRHGPRAESLLAGGIAFALGLYDGFFGPDCRRRHGLGSTWRESCPNLIVAARLAPQPAPPAQLFMARWRGREARRSR